MRTKNDPDACDLCGATLLSGAHGPGVCVRVPPTWDARYGRGAAQREPYARKPRLAWAKREDLLTPRWEATAALTVPLAVTQMGGVFFANEKDFRSTLEAAQLLAEEEARATLAKLAASAEAGLDALGRKEATAWRRAHVDPEAIPWRERDEPLAQALAACGAGDGEAADFFAAAMARAQKEYRRIAEATALPIRVVIAPSVQEERMRFYVREIAAGLERERALREQLSCPVVMSADTLRALLARAGDPEAASEDGSIPGPLACPWGCGHVTERPWDFDWSAGVQLTICPGCGKAVDLSVSYGARRSGESSPGPETPSVGTEGLYRCAGPSCPGYPYRASERLHPASCCAPPGSGSCPGCGHRGHSGRRCEVPICEDGRCACCDPPEAGYHGAPGDEL